MDNNACAIDYFQRKIVSTQYVIDNLERESSTVQDLYNLVLHLLITVEDFNVVDSIMGHEVTKKFCQSDKVADKELQHYASQFISAIDESIPAVEFIRKKNYVSTACADLVRYHLTD